MQHLWWAPPMCTHSKCVTDTDELEPATLAYQHHGLLLLEKHPGPRHPMHSPVPPQLLWFPASWSLSAAISLSQSQAWSYVALLVQLSGGIFFPPSSREASSTGKSPLPGLPQPVLPTCGQICLSSPGLPGMLRQCHQGWARSQAPDARGHSPVQIEPSTETNTHQAEFGVSPLQSRTLGLCPCCWLLYVRACGLNAGINPPSDSGSAQTRISLVRPRGGSAHGGEGVTNRTRQSRPVPPSRRPRRPSRISGAFRGASGFKSGREPRSLDPPCR